MLTRAPKGPPQDVNNVTNFNNLNGSHGSPQDSPWALGHPRPSWAIPRAPNGHLDPGEALGGPGNYENNLNSSNKSNTLNPGETLGSLGEPFKSL